MATYANLSNELFAYEPLAKEVRHLAISFDRAVDSLEAQKPSTAEFWGKAADLERIILREMIVQTRLTRRKFGGTMFNWQKTEEARMLFESLRAQKYWIGVFERQVDECDKRPSRLRLKKRGLNKKLPHALDFMKTRWNNRDLERNFYEETINSYNCRHPNKLDWFWCPVLGDWYFFKYTKATQLFPSIWNQDTMDAVFGKKECPELFLPRNGLIISSAIIKQFNTGRLVIVPIPPDKPTGNPLSRWRSKTPQEYKIRIIDPHWGKLDKKILHSSNLTWRELDNKQLQFRSVARPAIEYVYFHYCTQLLRRVWRQGPTSCPVPFTVEDTTGNPYWGQKGRYLPRNMLMRLAEELGHGHEDLLQGASRDTKDENLLLDLIVGQVQARRIRDDCNEPDLLLEIPVH